MTNGLNSDLRLCRIAALTSLALGPIGMTVSMLFLDSPRGTHILAGAAGFVGGAVLLAAGQVSLALLLPRGTG